MQSCIPSRVVASLGKGPTIKITYITCLYTVALPNRHTMASLYSRIAADFASVCARIITPEGAYRASNTKVGSGINSCIYCRRRKEFLFRA